MINEPMINEPEPIAVYVASYGLKRLLNTHFILIPLARISHQENFLCNSLPRKGFQNIQ